MTILSDLQTIEQRLKTEGDTPQVRRTFWRTVGQIKRLDHNEASEEIIVKTTAIRNHLFKQEVVLSVRKGLAIFFFVYLVALLGYLWVLIYFEATLDLFIILPMPIRIVVLNSLLLTICIFVAYGSYPWGRYLGGLIARVDFEGFYRYSPGELGLKIEYASYLRTTQSRRKWVYGFPIIWVFGSLILLAPITWILNPSGIWAPSIIICLFGIFYVAIYYRKTGELYRFIRELRISRKVKRRPN